MFGDLRSDETKTRRQGDRETRRQAVKCAYLKREPAVELYQVYEEILRMIVAMINHPESWIIKKE